jgi:hypothetical protein
MCWLNSFAWLRQARVVQKRRASGMNPVGIGLGVDGEGNLGIQLSMLGSLALSRQLTRNEVEELRDSMTFFLEKGPKAFMEESDRRNREKAMAAKLAIPPINNGPHGPRIVIS